MEQLLNYGLCADELKHISEVENGLTCNCVCPNCKHPLVAKNNQTNKKVGHFAHHSGKECEGAIETALHLLAKSILLKTKRLTTPKFHFDYNPKNENSVFKPIRELIFDNIILEKSVDIDGEKIIPDAIGEINGKQVYIEFAKTHFIDDGKKTKLRKSEIACIEIDLKGQMLDEPSLTSFFNSDTPSKYWIVNKRFDKEFADERKKRKEEKNILDKQRLNEIEKNRIKNDEKQKHFIGNSQFKIFEADDFGRVAKCPLKKIALTELKTSHFYRHSVFKQIVDGEFWNGQIYGYIPNGKWIFIGKEKVILFPSDNQREEKENEDKMSKFLYAGLQEIKKISDNPTFGNCINCKNYVDYFYIDNKDYKVCKHSLYDNQRVDNQGSS